jgi:hypothetical protein
VTAGRETVAIPTALSRLLQYYTACNIYYAVSGRAIAQVVSRWLPTAEARVRTRVWSSGICGGQSGAGADFLLVLRFSLPIFIPPNSPSSQSPGAGTIGHSVTDVTSGQSKDSTLVYENIMLLQICIFHLTKVIKLYLFYIK